MNGVDPLSQLHDIHLPPPVSWWPPAPGWWLLAALLLLTLCVFGLWCARRCRYRRYRRVALRQLHALYRQWQDEHDDLRFALATNRLLKQCALQSFPQHDVAALSGADWLAFLDRQLRRPRFTDPDLRGLASLYQPTPPRLAADALYAAAAHWIRRHRC